MVSISDISVNWGSGGNTWGQLKIWNLEYSNAIDKVEQHSKVVYTIQSLKIFLS